MNVYIKAKLKLILDFLFVKIVAPIRPTIRKKLKREHKSIITTGMATLKIKEYRLETSMQIQFHTTHK